MAVSENKKKSKKASLPPNGERVGITLTVSVDFKQRAQQAAQDDGRLTGPWIRKLVEEELERLEKEKAHVA